MEPVTLARLAIIGIVYFIAAVTALHFLRPDYHPMRRLLSEFAVGKYGWLMASAFIALAIGSLSLTVGIKQTLTATSWANVGFILLFIWSACIFVDGIFKTDLMGGEDTKSGLVHVLAAFLSFLAVIAASFVLSSEFSLDAQWQTIYSLSIILAVLITVTFIVSIYTLLVQQKFAGLGQRIFIISVLSWLLIIATQLTQFVG